MGDRRPAERFLVSEARQAELLERTVLALARRREELRIRGVVYFNWRDSLPYAGGVDFFGSTPGCCAETGAPSLHYRLIKRWPKRSV